MKYFIKESHYYEEYKQDILKDSNKKGSIWGIILFVLVILFMRFSLINVFNILFSFNTGPMWKYFHNTIDSSLVSQLILGILSLYPILPNQKGEDIFNEIKIDYDKDSLKVIATFLNPNFSTSF